MSEVCGEINLIVEVPVATFSAVELLLELLRPSVSDADGQFAFQSEPSSAVKLSVCKPKTSLIFVVFRRPSFEYVAGRAIRSILAQSASWRGFPGFSSQSNGTETTSFAGNGSEDETIGTAWEVHPCFGVPGFSSQRKGTDICCCPRCRGGGSKESFPVSMVSTGSIEGTYHAAFLLGKLRILISSCGFDVAIPQLRFVQPYHFTKQVVDFGALVNRQRLSLPVAKDW